MHPPGWIHCLSEALQTLSLLSTRLSALQIQGTWRPCRAFSNCWLTTSLLPLSTSTPAISEYPVQCPRFPDSVKGYHYHLLDVNRNAQTNALEGPNETSAKMWERNWMQWNLKCKCFPLGLPQLSSGAKARRRHNLTARLGVVRPEHNSITEVRSTIQEQNQGLPDLPM